jgi:hypothetical protein
MSGSFAPESWPGSGEIVLDEPTAAKVAQKNTPLFEQLGIITERQKMTTGTVKLPYNSTTSGHRSSAQVPGNEAAPMPDATLQVNKPITLRHAGAASIEIANFTINS